MAGNYRGPLHGIPVLIKDNIATADAMQTSAGSPALLAIDLLGARAVPLAPIAPAALPQALASGVSMPWACSRAISAARLLPASTSSACPRY